MKRKVIPSWNSNLAYIVGLIATDGNLSKDKRHILFTTTDRQLADVFQKCLGLNNKIIVTPPSGFGKKDVYRINFGNVNLYRWLQKIGLMANKMRIAGNLDIPDQYFVDFLRGHLDGDGSVFTYIDTYAIYKGKRYTFKRLYTSFISTNSKQIEWIQSQIFKILKIKGALTSYIRKDRKIPIWQLRFAKKDSLKLLSWLYYKRDLPCLNRKREIAERSLNRIK